MEQLVARRRYHEDQLRRLQVIEPQTGFEDLIAEQQESATTDEPYRGAVLMYESAKGRYPEVCSAHQPGYDIESYDGPRANPDRRLLRRIEVKGRSVAWEGSDIVTLSQRQFGDALRDSLEGREWDYWLYVVVRLSDSRYEVRPMRNPARAATLYAFRGDVWSALCKDPEVVDVSRVSSETADSI